MSLFEDWQQRRRQQRMREALGMRRQKREPRAAYYVIVVFIALITALASISIMRNTDRMIGGLAIFSFSVAIFSYALIRLFVDVNED